MVRTPVKLPKTLLCALGGLCLLGVVTFIVTATGPHRQRAWQIFLVNLVVPSLWHEPELPFGWLELLITLGFFAAFVLTYLAVVASLLVPLGIAAMAARSGHGCIQLGDKT